jgi:hypothetical protein
MNCLDFLINTQYQQTVANTIDPTIIDRRDWAAVQELIAEVQEAERIARKYASAIHLWDAAVRLFRHVERLQLFEQTPTADDLKIHEALLHGLLSLGQLLEIRIQHIDDEDLASFDIQRENLSAYVRELQDTFLMWHGPDLDPARSAELAKRIFGA